MEQSVERKQSIVGSLLTVNSQKYSKFKLAFWYRVVGETRTILKMQTITKSVNLFYRCSVFDVGAVIELRVENQQEEQVTCFGPVKFDSYFNKQLEDPKLVNTIFSAHIHFKLIETVPTRIKLNNGNNCLVLIFEAKGQKQTIFQIPIQQDWRTYESMFDVSTSKITDICFRNSENIAKFVQNFFKIDVCLENRNYVLITFANVLERNLFLAQIIKKTRLIEQSKNGGPRQTKLSQPRSSIQNDMDDLFKSSVMPRNSFTSQKALGEMKQIIFTPKLEEGEQQTVQKAFNTLNFDNFLNPEDTKDKKKQILSDIVEDEHDYEKSMISMKRAKYLHDQRLRFTEKYEISQKGSQEGSEKIFEKIRWDKIERQNKKLLEQNKRLRWQNKNLRKKLNINAEYNIKIKYNLPQFFKKKATKKQQSDNPLSHRYRTTNIEQQQQRQKACQYESTQTTHLTHLQSNTKQGTFSQNQMQESWKSKQKLKKNRSDDSRRMAKTVSVNSKSIKLILSQNQMRNQWD